MPDLRLADEDEARGMNTAAEHPIQLDRVMFLRSSVVAIPNHVPGLPDAPLPQPINTIGLQQVPKEPLRYSATMRTVINQSEDASFPYSIDMECIGMFIVAPGLSLEEAHRGVLITAHSVLYGAIREAVSWLTSRQPYGALMLGLSILQSSAPPAQD